MSLGIPYMGSKRKLSKQIINHILEHNPKCKYFYDLFGGGGAISFEALQRPQIKQVFYNELNTGVVELLKDIINNGVTEKYYQWVDRETFMKHKNDNNWFGGLLKTCWSFGNNQKGYLFGKDIEINKRLLHEVVVNQDLDCLKQFNENFNINIGIKNMTGDTVNERRLKLQRIMTESIKDKSVLKNFCVSEENSVRSILQQLERLQQLQQLERLEQLQQLNISNLSYDEVEITKPIDETIIYLDPPYKNTGKYQKDICHDSLLNYIKNSPYKIYVSSYDFDLPVVAEWNHISTLSATNNSKVVIEKLFCNQKENLNSTYLF